MSASASPAAVDQTGDHGDELLQVGSLEEGVVVCPVTLLLLHCI